MHRTPRRPSLVGRVGRARTTGGPFPSINLGRSTVSNSSRVAVRRTTMQCNSPRTRRRVPLAREIVDLETRLTEARSEQTAARAALALAEAADTEAATGLATVEAVKRLQIQEQAQALEIYLGHLARRRRRHADRIAASAAQFEAQAPDEAFQGRIRTGRADPCGPATPARASAADAPA